jgi:hypothetical protein
VSRAGRARAPVDNALASLAPALFTLASLAPALFTLASLAPALFTLASLAPALFTLAARRCLFLLPRPAQRGEGGVRGGRWCGRR